MKLNLKTKIPNGKHKGKTLNQIIKSDPNYYKWMLQNGILEQWGLILPETKPKQTIKIDKPFVASDGSVWLGLYEVETEQNGKS